MARIAQETTDNLNGLIAVLHDGVELHETAINEITSTDVKQVSREMIDERRKTIEELKPLVVKGGREPTTRGTFLGDARAMLAKVKALIGDRDAAYAGELARMEEITVSTIDTCIEDTADKQVSDRLAERKKPFDKAAEKLHELSGGAKA